VGVSLTILKKLYPESDLYKWLYSDEILDETYEGRDNVIQIQLPRFAFYTVTDALNILKRLRAAAEREGITLMKDPYADIERYVKGIRRASEEDCSDLLSSFIDISDKTITAGRMDTITTLVHEARHIALHKQRNCLDERQREINCLEAEADCIDNLMIVDNLRTRSNRRCQTYWDEYGLDIVGQRYDRQNFLELRRLGLNLC
jgi:hypothetical protein